MDAETSALLERASALRRAGKVDEAIAAYCQLLEREPDLPDSWYNLGFLQRKARQFEASLASYAQALKRGVRDPEPFLRRAGALLDDAVRTSGAVATGGLGALWANQVDEDGEEDVTAFVPVYRALPLGETSLAAGIRVGELPATDVAVVVHHGTFETMIDTYRNLGAWVATNAEPADLAVREYYLDELNTEICWPVH